MPPLKRGKRSNTDNRTKRMRQRKRGVQRSLKPGTERTNVLKEYINNQSFNVNANTDHQELFRKIKNNVKTIRKNDFVKCDDDGSLGGLRYPICLRPNLVNLCCELVNIDESELMKEGTAYPYFLKKLNKSDAHQDVDFFVNNRINTAIIYIKATGNASLRIYETGYTKYTNGEKILLDIRQEAGMVIKFPSHLIHEVIVDIGEINKESREMIVMSYHVK